MAGMSFVCPGDRLRHSSEVRAGAGTCVRPSDGAVCATLAGQARLTAAAEGAADPLPLAEVLRGRSDGASLPQPGATVLVRVKNVTPRLATCDIVVVDGAAAAADASFSGIIRQQDVREKEVDSVVLYDCFRPGDVVRASVLSLGDARSYYLSTASDELGVVSARAAQSGEVMAPVSWTEMQCPRTGITERRKVAKQ
jgi:exosome complex component CSL4